MCKSVQNLEKYNQSQVQQEQEDDMFGSATKFLGYITSMMHLITQLQSAILWILEMSCPTSLILAKM